jgi:hypothetical protein
MPSSCMGCWSSVAALSLLNARQLADPDAMRRVRLLSRVCLLRRGSAWRASAGSWAREAQGPLPGVPGQLLMPSTQGRWLSSQGEERASPCCVGCGASQETGPWQSTRIGPAPVPSIEGPRGPNGGELRRSVGSELPPGSTGSITSTRSGPAPGRGWHASGRVSSAAAATGSPGHCLHGSPSV